MMRSHRILQLNAIATAACGVGMLALRSALHPLFALETPLLLDILAVGLLLYAGALAWAAHNPPVTRQALMLFTIADGLWVAASAVVLVMFWTQLAPVARVLVIAVAIVVEVFATLQFRAAGKVASGSPQMA
jgi:hypothetical protein